MEIWKVQTESSKDGKGYWVGQIIEGKGFEDTPDSDYISGGYNAKGISGVAIGRCANVMHWGFSASPNYMTEAAKQVFVNAVFYMAKYNGKQAITRYKSNARKWTEYMLQRKVNQKIDLTSKEFISTGNTERDSIIKYYLENYPYFYMKGRGLTAIIDEEAKSLGIPNNDIKLLEKCIEMLENNEDIEKANTLLNRYTVHSFATANEWRDWYDTYKNYLFFTETGGYKYLVDTYNYPELKGANKVKSLSNNTTTKEKEIVALQMKLIPKGDNDYTIEMTVNIQDDWHIYAFVPESESYILTKISFDFPRGISRKGKLIKPKSYDYDNGIKIYKGKVVFKQNINVSKKKMKEGVIKCSVYFQTCNAYMCKAPTTLTSEIKLK